MRHGLTLIEVLISTMILAVAGMTILLLIPEALQNQRSNRFKMVASMHAQTLVDSFVQHEYDYKLQHMRLFADDDGNDGKDAMADTVYSESGVKHDPPTARKSVSDQYKAFGPIMGVNGRYDIENLLLNSIGGLYPIPPAIARRLDSPNDEIKHILDGGGQVFYFEPSLARRFDAQLRRSRGASVEGVMQRLIVGIVGPPQQNVSPTSPGLEPIYEQYPFPPMPYYRHSGLNAWQSSAGWVVTGTRTYAIGDNYQGAVLTSPLTVATYQPAATVYNWGMDGLGRYALVYPRDNANLIPSHTWQRGYWEGGTWEWLARLENQTISDADEPETLRVGELAKEANRWRAGLEAFRRLHALHWGRIMHQIDAIGFSGSPVTSPATGSKNIGTTTITETIWEPQRDPISGGIALGPDGTPIFTSRTITRTENVSVPWDAGNNQAVELTGTNASSRVSRRGYPAPAMGLGFSTIEGSDILEEDAATGFTDLDSRIQIGMPSLERRVKYRSAALALWASVACFDPAGVVDITDPVDRTKVLVDTDGSEGADVGAYRDFCPNVSVTGMLGTPSVKRYLPKVANPLLTPFDDLCLVRFTSHRSFEQVRLKDVLRNTEQLDPSAFAALQAAGGGWNQLVHPAQVLALNHLAHAAVIVTGYQPPFYDELNDGNPLAHVLIRPNRDAQMPPSLAVGEEWRLPYKAEEPTYRIDPELDPALGTDLDIGSARIKQRFLSVRLPDDSRTWFDQATGELLIAEASPSPPSIGYDGKSPHARDLFTGNGIDRPGPDGVEDDCDLDGKPDRAIYLTDPRTNLVLLQNPYHHTAFPRSGTASVDGIYINNPGPYRLPGLDPDRLGGATVGDIDDPGEGSFAGDGNNYHDEDALLAIGDLGVGMAMPYTEGNKDAINQIWTNPIDRNAVWRRMARHPMEPGSRWMHPRHGDIIGVAGSNPPPADSSKIGLMNPAPSTTAQWGDHANQSVPPLGPVHVPWWNRMLDTSVVFDRAMPVLQWTNDWNRDGVAGDPGPIAYRPLVGPVLNKFPPPYANRNHLDMGGFRRFHTEYHLRIVDASKNTYSLVRMFKDPSGTVSGRPDSTMAANAHESCLRLAIGYVSQNPYDLSVPRPVNRQCFTDRPLSCEDLFDAAGRARRPESVPANQLPFSIHPFTSPPTAPWRVANPTANTAAVINPLSWNSGFFSDYQTTNLPSAYGGNGLFLIPTNLPMISGRNAGKGGPWCFGSPLVGPDDPFDSTTGYRLVRDDAGRLPTDAGYTNPRFLGDNFGLPNTPSVGGYFGLNDRTVSRTLCLPPTDSNRDKHHYPSFGYGWYGAPRRYHSWVNAFHGYFDPDVPAETNRRRQEAWQIGAERPDRFFQTRPWQPHMRSRQIVYWMVNWQQYEDFESAAGAPLDLSKLASKVGVGTSVMTRTNPPSISTLTASPAPIDSQVGRYEWITLQFDSGDKATVWVNEDPITPPTYDLVYVNATDAAGNTTSDGNTARTWVTTWFNAGRTATITWPRTWVYQRKDSRFPLGHPERSLAWLDPEHTSTLLVRDSSRAETVILGTAGAGSSQVTERIVSPSGHRALHAVTQGVAFGISTDLQDRMISQHLAPFGADRNGNGRFDMGDVPAGQRMRAEVVTRFNYYDPVMWMSAGR